MVPDTETCRILKFTNPKPDRYLEHHVIQSILVDDNDHCQLKCYVEKTCLSYNLGALASGDKLLCELSSSDHYQHPGDLIFKKGFSYHAAVVSVLPATWGLLIAMVIGNIGKWKVSLGMVHKKYFCVNLYHTKLFSAPKDCINFAQIKLLKLLILLAGRQ